MYDKFHKVRPNVQEVILLKPSDLYCFRRHIENIATTMQRSQSAHTSCLQSKEENIYLITQESS